MKNAYMKSAVVIWLLVLSVIFIKHLDNWVYIVAVPFSFIILIFGYALQWDSDFRNADFKTKRRMARELHDENRFISYY